MGYSQNARFIFALLMAVVPPKDARSDAFPKLQMKKLEAVLRAVEALKEEWRAVPLSRPFHEHRANIHVHSHWSHDSRGRIDEIIAAANATSTSVLNLYRHDDSRFDRIPIAFLCVQLLAK
jgi:hypothetical protein